jgi:hypothetical protein
MDDENTWLLYHDDFEPAWKSRTEHAEVLEADADAFEKEAAEMRAKAIGLRKYKDDTDELAHLIAEVSDVAGRANLAAAIYKVLTKFNVKASITGE